MSSIEPLAPPEAVQRKTRTPAGLSRRRQSSEHGATMKRTSPPAGLPRRRQSPEHEAPTKRGSPPAGLPRRRQSSEQGARTRRSRPPGGFTPPEAKFRGRRGTEEGGARARDRRASPRAVPSTERFFSSLLSTLSLNFPLRRGKPAGGGERSTKVAAARRRCFGCFACCPMRAGRPRSQRKQQGTAFGRASLSENPRKELRPSSGSGGEAPGCPRQCRRAPWRWVPEPPASHWVRHWSYRSRTKPRKSQPDLGRLRL